MCDTYDLLSNQDKIVQKIVEKQAFSCVIWSCQSGVSLIFHFSATLAQVPHKYLKQTLQEFESVNNDLKERERHKVIRPYHAKRKWHSFFISRSCTL